MPTYGQRPEDVISDTRGNALKNVEVRLYHSEADATTGDSVVGSAFSDERGRWSFEAAAGELWARLPDGTVWQVSDPGNLEDYLNITSGDERYYTQDQIDAMIAAEVASRVGGDAGKSDIGHDHNELYYTEAEVDALIDGIDTGGGPVAWDDVTGKPSTFAPSAHTHPTSEVTGLDTALGNKLDTSAAPELIRDTMGTALVAGSNVTITPNDGSDTITIASTASGSSSTITANVQTSDYTAVLSDAGKVIELNKATGIQLTIPPSSSVAWVAGTVMNVYQAGAGNATIVGGSGVTIRNLAPLRGQYAEASLRYRGSDEWVLEGDLAVTTQYILKDYDEKTRTAGDITLNQTAVTAVNTALDLTIAASAGDLVEVGISGLHNTGAPIVCYEIYTLPSGTPVNPFGAGIAASLADNKQGIAGWEIQNSGYEQLTGGISKVLAAGDVSGGTTTLRLYYAKVNTTARTLFANADIPLKIWVKNFGQV